jgi:hypothetical protein
MLACQPERHINTNRDDNKLPPAALPDLQSRGATLQPPSAWPRLRVLGGDHD